MNDQAEMLRKIVNMKTGNVDSGLPDESSAKKARVLTVTSGKGGVGKLILPLT